MVVNQTLFAQVRSAAPQIYETALRDCCIGARLHHQRDNSAFVCNIFKITSRGEVQIGCARLNSLIPSFSLMLPTFEITSESLLLILGAGMHKKRLTSRSYCKAAYIYIENIETGIYLHTIRGRISEHNARAIWWCRTSAHAYCVYRNIVEQIRNFRRKPKPAVNGRQRYVETKAQQTTSTMDIKNTTYNQNQKRLTTKIFRIKKMKTEQKVGSKQTRRRRTTSQLV